MPERIEVRAVRNGGRDYMEVPTARESMIAALREERRGYATRGLIDRVELVDIELAKLGARSETNSERNKRGHHG